MYNLKTIVSRCRMARYIKKLKLSFVVSLGKLDRDVIPGKVEKIIVVAQLKV